jgi:hypothetical protein
MIDFLRQARHQQQQLTAAAQQAKSQGHPS